MDHQAFAQLLGNYGEFVGALGVVLSLLFVGYSIVQNTKATRAQTHQAITQSFMSIAEVIAERPEAFAAGVISDSREFEELDAGDKAFFIASIFGLFKYFELMFMQHRDGNTDDESWNAWSQHMLMQFHQPGVKAWWSLRETTFHPAFRKFLNESEPPKMKTFAELMHS
jgi:hypothetical protein